MCLLIFSVSQKLNGVGQSVEFLFSDKKIIWNIKKMIGKSEVSANLTVVYLVN